LDKALGEIGSRMAMDAKTGNIHFQLIIGSPGLTMGGIIGILMEIRDSLI
jgi:hypothetical protein